MSMTRNLVVGAAVVVAAYSGAAWYIGTKAEAEIQHQVAEFNAAAADYGAVQLNIVNYHRHWFSADINYELLIDDGAEQHQLLLEDKLRHGPLPAAALLRGRFAPLLAYSELKLLPSQNVQPWFDATKGLTPVTAHSFIDFNGSSKSQIDLAAVDYQNEFGEQLQMSAATLNVSYKTDTQALALDAVLPDLAVVDAETETQIQLKELHFDGHVLDSEQGQSSEGALRIQQARVAMVDAVEVVVDTISAHSTSELYGNLVDSALHYDLAKVSIDGHDIGQIELDLDFKRVNYEVLALLSQPELMDDLSEAELQPILEQFFSHQPELVIQPFSWRNAAGESQVTADLKMAATAADTYPNNEVDLAHFFEALDINASISRPMLQALFAEDGFSRSLVDMLFTQMAKKGQEAGLVVYDGSVASLQLRFDAASQTLMLNGKPTDPNELFYAWLALQMGGGLMR